VLQVPVARDVDSKSVAESLVQLHQRDSIVTSLKTWLHVLHVGICACDSSAL